MSDDWKDAACRGLATSLFFPTTGESSSEAKAVCRGCPVRQKCIDFAVENGEKFGIWGGLSEKERRRNRAQRERVVPHGASRYRGGCHCQECRDGHAEYERRRAGRQRLRRLA